VLNKPNTKPTTFWPYFLIFLSTLLLYANSLNSPLFFDDHNVMRNASLFSLWDHLKFALQFKSRAIVMFSFKLNQLSPESWLQWLHATNIAFHALNGCLVYLLLNKLCTQKQKAWFIPLWATLIFICHPNQVIAVSYITQRFMIMMTFFYLSAIILYISIRQNQAQSDAPQLKKQSSLSSFWLKYILLILCIFLGNMSKEAYISLPLVLICLEFTFLNNTKTSWKKKLLILTPLILISFLPLILRFFPQISTSAYSFTKEGLLDSTHHTIPGYLAMSVMILFKYITLFFLPSGSHFMHGDFLYYKTFFHIPVLIILFFHLCFFFYALTHYKKTPLFTFAVCFFYITISPEHSFLPLEWPMFEYRTYLSFMGFSILIPFTLFLIANKFKHKSLSSPKTIFSTVLIACILFLSLQSVAKNIVYKSNIEIWKQSVEQSPNQNVAYGQLGTAYLTNNNYRDALQAYTRALELKPYDTRYALAIGMCHISLQNLEKGMYWINKIKALPHLSVNELLFIAHAHDTKGYHDKALHFLKMAQEKDASNQRKKRDK
jgi:protein O-mannosyl-transferase